MTGERRVARATAALLLALPFGFEEVGEADGLVVLRRAAAPRRASDLPKNERWAEARALALVAEVARGLALVEARGLFPGPLVPEEVAIEDGAVHLRFDAFVAKLAGEIDPSPEGTTSTRHRDMSPEVLGGEPWSNRDNRYAIGLIAYRLLAGEHPFDGLSLRALEKAQLAGPAPFTEDVAAKLSPGVMSFVLSLLAPHAAERPASAREIAARASALAGSAKAPDRRADVTRFEARRTAVRGPVAAPGPRGDTRAATRPRGIRAWTAPAIGLFVGLVLAAYGVFAGPARGDATSAPRVVPRSSATPVGIGSGACKACHAREFEEWQRSVMAYSVKSPLFGGLESAIEEEAGRGDDCPNGAGILRHPGATTCRNRDERITGAGGEGWCQNCHAPLAAATGAGAAAPGRGGSRVVDRGGPAWSALGDPDSRRPLLSLLSKEAEDGIACTLCHATVGPVGPHASRAGSSLGYEGNPTWRSFETGQVFGARPEDREGRFGIANSGYALDLGRFARTDTTKLGEPGVHARPSPDTSRYLRSSEFCGSCHDVRLFGADAGEGRERGESFKRLRNAYSEWRDFSEREARASRVAPTCQDCHMSLFPGVCERAPDAKSVAGDGCPPGTRWSARSPGSYGRKDDGSGLRRSHFFTSVDVPLAPSFPESFIRDRELDPDGIPMGLDARRTMLLRSALTMQIGETRRSGGALEIPITIENVGAGHKVPAGFSQERELWVELVVRDASGRVVYEVGRVDRDDEDLKDKRLVRVRVSPADLDRQGRPLGIFGADVVDGPDVPEWRSTRNRSNRFVGRGLVNFQNGFQRCVRCIGVIDVSGKCQPGPGQGKTRADRFEDGAYDLDTGECRSNLTGANALFETYLPVGALDADRGVFKAPDAIIDTRALSPKEPVTYTYQVSTRGGAGPFTIEARLRFRAFPPYLIRTFADFEAHKARLGLRPPSANGRGGAQVDASMLGRLRIADLASARARTP